MSEREKLKPEEKVKNRNKIHSGRGKHKLYLAEMERDLLKKLDEIERRDAFRK